MALSVLSLRAEDVYESAQPRMLRETIPFIVLATLAVIGRFISTKFRKASFGPDDYMITVALVRLCR